MITDFSMISSIVSICFHQTGNKFSVDFNGSKGYLTNIEISCEGRQKERNNIIWVEKLLTKARTLPIKIVSVFHSEETGVRLEIADFQKVADSKSIAVKDLKFGDQYKIGKQRKFRTVMKLVTLPLTTGPEEHRGKILIVHVNCSQRVMAPDALVDLKEEV